jgi:hypothetical protein
MLHDVYLMCSEFSFVTQSISSISFKLHCLISTTWLVGVAVRPENVPKFALLAPPQSYLYIFLSSPFNILLFSFSRVSIELAPNNCIAPQKPLIGAFARQNRSLPMRSRERKEKGRHLGGRVPINFPRNWTELRG